VNAGRALLAGLIVAAVGLVAGGSATPAAGAPCRPSVNAGGGPFDTNAAAPPRRTRIGRGHVLTGRVLQYPGCTPIRGAFVEFWQESANGRYDRRGHGSMVTSRAGTFRFEGPIPPSDFGRPHIHVHVSAAGYPDFVTTYFIARGSRQGRLTIVLVSDI
jgi:protocatechuate 3,4-dioxygenase beta subunit